MAARSSTSSRARAKDNGKSTETQTPDTTEITEESTVTTTVEPSTESTEVQTETPAETSAEFDLAPFLGVVSEAVDSRDTSTGTVSVEQIQNVKTAFSGLPSVKAKNAAKKELQDLLRNAIKNNDIITGKAVMDISDSLVSAPSTQSTAKAPADPREAYLQRLTAITLAYQLVAQDAPDEVDGDEAIQAAQSAAEELSDAAATHFAWMKSTAEDKGEEPEVSAEVKIATKLALGKATRVATKTPRAASNGHRGNVVSHILEAVRGRESGTFLTVRELSTVATEQYPQGNVSPGAINARLFPDGGKSVSDELLNLVTPNTNDAGKKGVTVN